MCGICGIYYFDATKQVDEKVLAGMNEALAHRGPDGECYHVNGNIGLAHRRLVIIDSETGGQPMSNEDGSVWVICNGEIYNYVELREELLKKGHTFKTRSDTEVIVHLYEEHGEGCLGFLRGMFAFALWDESAKRLLVARDRIGKKPLFYLHKNGCFIFASEIKAILEFPGYRKEIDFRGLNHLYAYDWWIPWPFTAFRNIYKMEPATYFLIEKGGLVSRKYWKPDFTVKRIKNQAAVAEELYRLVDESVRIRLRSDVPLGAMLSGGVDSSGVVAVMKDYVSSVKTFTLGFSEGGNVDSEFLRARDVARQFGTEHHEVLFSPEDLFENLPQMIKNHDEPYVCMTGLYTWFLTRFVKQQGVTVLLSGNGPDEIFWGYSSGVDLKIKGIVNRMAGMFPPAFRGALARHAFSSRAFRERAGNLGMDFSHKLEQGINRNFIEATGKLYGGMYPDFPVTYGSMAKRYFSEAGTDDLVNGYIYTALMLTYSYGLTLQPDLDGMANAVEIRSPFLDHKIIEFAAGLPSGLKIKGFSPRGCKYILKKAMEKKLPRSLLYAEKFNFGMYIQWESWIRQNYGKQVRELLLNGWWVKNGYWDREYVKALLEKDDVRAPGMQVLRLLSSELWYRIYFENENP